MRPVLRLCRGCLRPRWRKSPGECPSSNLEQVRVPQGSSTSRHSTREPDVDGGRDLAQRSSKSRAHAPPGDCSVGPEPSTVSSWAASSKTCRMAEPPAGVHRRSRRKHRRGTSGIGVGAPSIPVVVVRVFAAHPRGGAGCADAAAPSPQDGRGGVPRRSSCSSCCPPTSRRRSRLEERTPVGAEGIDHACR
jgi:hypothetical protein